MRIKVAAVQTDVTIGDKRTNLERIDRETRQAAANGINLVVFSECALTGYNYSNLEQAVPYMEPVPGPSTFELEKSCRDGGIYIVYGMLEKSGDNHYNTAVLLGPEGYLGKYRKIHLPFLGIDRFLDRGNEKFPVFETGIGKIGIMICYDAMFPESSRVMALNGAEVICLPTNWPDGRSRVPDFVVPTRAMENHVYIIAANRVGTERGTGFIGLSRIVNVWGDILIETGKTEQVISAEIDPAEARQKHIIYKEGQFEVDLMVDRRPDYYTDICTEN